MSKYVVTFFKGVMDSEGHRTNAPQMALEVRAKGPEEAIAHCQERFARLRGIPDWRLHADSYELAEIDERP
jgi:hypothetical protein